MSEIEARVTHKLRWRILPFVMLLYFVSFLDRVNVGFAAFSMNKAIGLSSSAYGFGSGIFFLGYIIFQVPANVIMLRVGADCTRSDRMGIGVGCLGVCDWAAQLLRAALPARPG
jgi:MFS family permease